MSKKEVMDEIQGHLGELENHFHELEFKLIERAEENLNPAIDGGLNWLKQAQNVDGGFGATKGDESIFHLTAFALLALAKGGRSQDNEIIQNTLKYLQKHQAPEGWWPLHNESSSESIGVTGMIVQALDILNIKKAEEIFREALEYLKESFLMKYGCWQDNKTAPLWEISVNESAFSAINKFAAKKEKAKIDKFRDIFLEHDSDDGYGWKIDKNTRIDGDIENTAIALKILANLGYNTQNDTEFRHVEKAINYILGSQVRTGGFPPRKQLRKDVKEAEIDATALVLSGLVACGYNTYNHVIHSAAQFLMDGRNEDGGWGDTPRNNHSDTDSTALAIIGLVDAGKGAVPLSEVRQHISETKAYVENFIEKHVSQLDNDLQHTRRLNRLLEINIAFLAVVIPIIMSFLL